MVVRAVWVIFSSYNNVKEGAEQDLNKRKGKKGAEIYISLRVAKMLAWTLG